MFSEIDDDMMVLLARFGVRQAEARRQLAQASPAGGGIPLSQVAAALLLTVIGRVGVEVAEHLKGRP